MKIILIGYMGSGKTTVGKILAQKVQWPFKDLDTEIANDEGETIRAVFEKKGEIYFRKKEGLMLQKLLMMNDNFVLATGGGTPCYGNNLSSLLEDSSSRVVYLKSDLSVLAQRLFLERAERPLLAHFSTLEALREYVGIHLFERAHYYNQTPYRISVENKTPEVVAEEIINLIF